MNKELKKIKESNHTLTAEISNDLNIINNHVDLISGEYNRVDKITSAPSIILSDIDKQFKDLTKLESIDIKFLFLATALQIARQILQPKLTSAGSRLSHDEAAKDAKQLENDFIEKIKNKENLNPKELNKYNNYRKHKYYNPSLEEILINPVPFDANIDPKKRGLLSGFGFLGHRGATPGHDPVLGLLFGTANIATSTLTNWDMLSVHIYSSFPKKGDIFGNDASTIRVFDYTSDKLLHQGHDGKIIIGTSVAKEIIHLKSDVNSKKSLPLPFISAISPQFAGDLAKYGFDMANIFAIVKQASYATIINTIIAIVHSFFYDEATGISRNEFGVKTRKILLYSNLIATTSNIIATAISENIEVLDLGGLAVTLYRLISDICFIEKVKEEFIKNELYNHIARNEYDFIKGDF